MWNKSNLTIEIENALISRAMRRGQRFGKEIVAYGARSRYKDYGGIVDFVEAKYDYREHRPHIIFYEIKVSYSDFNSPNGHNVGGDEFYYVIPIELYNEILEKNPRLFGDENIGIIVYQSKRLLVKRKPSGFIRHKPTIENRFLILDDLIRVWQNNVMGK